MRTIMKRFLFVTLAAVQTGMTAGVAMAQQSSGYEAQRSDELNDRSAALLRESRELITAARRGGYERLRDRADDFYRQAIRVYQGIQDGVSDYVLGNDIEDLELIFLSAVRREANRIRDRVIEDAYGDLRRGFFALKSSFEDDLPAVVTDLEAVYSTYFKATTAQSSSLPSSRKCLVTRDQIIVAEGDVFLGSGHVRVTLAESIRGCGFGSRGQVGYIYAPHFRYY